MAKGRRFGSDRHERLLGSFHQGMESEALELGEDEVWSMVHDRDDQINYPASNQWHFDRGQNEHSINHEHRQVGGLSLAIKDSVKTQSSKLVHHYHSQGSMSSSRQTAQSAPMNVPNWPKILQMDSAETVHDLDDCTEDHGSDKVPPHEYLAQEYARDRNHKMAATSVLEGVGRTLKGRDIIRVRDAVWSQTGFYG